MIWGMYAMPRCAACFPGESHAPALLIDAGSFLLLEDGSKLLL